MTTPPADRYPHPAYPLEPVRAPVMVHDWQRITFLHWAYDPDAVQRLLPPGLRVETRDGRAWVGLVPFGMVVRPPVAPFALSRFPETNVRTYAVGPGGRTGVWFLSLDAGDPLAVAAARLTYRLPYFWSAMSIAQQEGEIAYDSRRRVPGPPGAGTSIRVRPGVRLGAGETTEVDHYLTARFGLFTVIGGRLWFARAEHRPWPLQRAELTALEESLVVAAGLPAPEGEPIVHWSAGVRVKIGAPRPV